MDKGVIDNGINPSISKDVFEKTVEYLYDRLDKLFPKEKDRHVAINIVSM